MKRLISLSATVVSMTLVLAGSLTGTVRAAGAQERPIRVAVANVPRIFLELQETKDLDDRFKQERNRLASEEAPMVTQLKDMEAEGRNYRQGSPQYEEWRQRYSKARVNYKAWVEVAKTDMDWKRKKQTRELYDKIYAAVSDYAAGNQIDLVVADHQPTMTDKDLEQIPAENLPAILNQRRVIFASKSADISDAIIASLDAKYKAGGGAGAAVGAAGGGQGNSGAANADTAGGNLRGQTPPAGQPSGQPAGQGSPQRRPTNR